MKLNKKYTALLLAGVLACSSGVAGLAPLATYADKTETGAETSTDDKSSVPTRQEVVDYAMQWVGKVHYADYGNGEHSKTDGLVEGCASDCSWFIYNVLHHFGLMDNYARSVGWGSDTPQDPKKYSDENQVPGTYAVDIPITEAKPGDIEFWDEGNNAGHVAIYIGNGQAVACNGYFTDEYKAEHDGQVGAVELTDYKTTIGRDPDKIVRLKAFDAEDKKAAEETKKTEKDGKHSTSENVVMVNPFKDVAEKNYYYDAVLWAVGNKITSGTSKTTFSPKSSCTRAQIVTFLYNCYGRDTVSTYDLAKTKIKFKDVPDNAYYADAVRWAVAKGITKGRSKTSFAPKASCTRAEAATFLYKTIGNGARAKKNSFLDVSADRFYTKAISWASANGITSGVSSKKFGVSKACTRAEIVSFLYRARNL